mmetsp:Transcript_27558/g.95295  ORF Transcript_27558/g.95295 Transcript_27558/m.95295 type:complete len:202 (+) Transcript_27558:2002-2607(+)
MHHSRTTAATSTTDCATKEGGARSGRRHRAGLVGLVLVVVRVRRHRHFWEVPRRHLLVAQPLLPPAARPETREIRDVVLRGEVSFLDGGALDEKLVRNRGVAPHTVAAKLLHVDRRRVDGLNHHRHDNRRPGLQHSHRRGHQVPVWCRRLNLEGHHEPRRRRRVLQHQRRFCHRAHLQRERHLVIRREPQELPLPPGYLAR